MSSRSLVWLAVLALLGVAAVAFVLGSRRSSVDWRQVRAVVIESDDWGLCGFFPDSLTLARIDRSALAAGYFPEVYWGSTLEDSAAVAGLCGRLAGFRGRDGLPPVMQPNYIVGSLTYVTEGRAAPVGGDLLATAPDGARWYRTRYPYLAAQYTRPGLGQAVDAGIRAGVWYPELHGCYHFDPQRRLSAVQTSDSAREAAAAGVILFPEAGSAWELGPWRERDQLAAELSFAVAGFSERFGRPPASVIAPDYVWNAAMEDLWQQAGITVIQAKREQRPATHPDSSGWLRLRKVLTRTWERLINPDRIYLERNCRFEPVQAARPADVVARCVAEVESAWRRGEPAIIESHRINFVHIDRDVARRGRELLASVLAELQTRSDAPLYLTDMEVAQLDRRGVSWCRRGDRLVVRNLTHGRRVVSIPVDVVSAMFAGRSEPDCGRPPAYLVPVPPGSTLVLTPAELARSGGGVTADREAAGYRAGNSWQ